ncbi:M4 family metallopeptidase [Streptomyces sp. S.PB5]|uniref:M4 family metallopeptidase n=1 Tax=Streptomyces sp. S.PB5 TaxID=3020844 RepID=UPI0025AF1247|nr:M4 family metallopeptidase [Streptomyces sp. S.PB5]MDN3028435.1 M4 family metallopeptidase [Streptomyces sp. S.PB5]
MDSTLLAAAIGTVGGGLVTAGGAWLRVRSSVRTAARLVYAELTRDSAAVAYARFTGRWAPSALSRTAWDTHGAVIARRRSTAFFQAVHRGYEALEIVPVLAEESLDEELRERLVREPLTWLVRAIEELGKAAGISAEQIRAVTDRLDGRRTTRVERLTVLPHVRTGVVPLPLLERLATAGTAIWPDTGHVVCDAGQREEGFVAARRTGQNPTGDPAVDGAYEALHVISDFGHAVLGRDLPADGPLNLVVHYGESYSNAFWRGEDLYVGDGDGEIFGSFSGCVDLIAHEVWRGVPEMGRLGGAGESAALYASLCDVFAELIKQFGRGESAGEADWVVGAGVLAPKVNGVGLRSLKAPGTAYDDEVLGRDAQPSHMDGYVCDGPADINSGVPNHAFYLLATELGGHAWEHAGRIWWDALTGDGVHKGLLFADWARLTAAAAAARYGDSSREHRAVLAAWAAVGVPGSADAG